jgi:hypothetical protein
MADHGAARDMKEKVESWAHILVVAVGLIYGSGFLIVFTFYKSFEIDSTEFIDARYIHVGSLFAMPCLAAYLTLNWFLRFRSKDKRKWWTSFVSPQWDSQPAHGLHINLPVLGTAILLLWCFILLATLAKTDFVYKHAQLIFLNFLPTLFILIIALIGDLFKGQEFNHTAQQKLTLIWRALRIWYAVAIVAYLLWYWINRDSLDELACIPEAVFLVLPLIYIGAAWIVLRRANPKSHAPTQWALYSMQWSLFAFQICVFAAIIRNKNLDLSLKEILFGYDWHSTPFFQDIIGFNWTQSPNFPHGAIYMVLFLFLAMFFLIRIRYRLQQYEVEHQQRMSGSRGLPTDWNDAAKFSVVASTLIMVGIFLYLSILGFARFVYPYIPYAKGGGDYSSSEPVQITFNQNALTPAGYAIVLPKKLLDLDAAGRLIILDENTNFIYLADIDDAGGPKHWRSSRDKPYVYEIRHEAVSCIISRAGLKPSDAAPEPPKA